MNICFYCPLLLGTGGMETVLSLLIKGLRKKEHSCFLIFPSKNDSVNTLWLDDLSGCNIVYTSYIYKDNIIQEALDFQTIIKSLPPIDIIISLNSKGTAVAKLASNILNPPPLVVTQVHFSLTKISTDYLKLADAHLAISTGIRSQLKEKLLGKPIYYLPNPIKDTEGFLIKRPEVTTFAYVGRISNVQKRLDILFKALSHLKKEEWILKIVGDDTSKNYINDARMLKDLSEKLGISDRIQWMGYQKDPWKALEEASVLLLTSEYEGFGLVLAEALARGLPVVSSDCPVGPSDIVIDNHNGWMFDITKPELLVNLLESIIKKEVHLPDPKTCIESVVKFSENVIIQDFEHIIYLLLNEKKEEYYELSKEGKIASHME